MDDNRNRLPRPSFFTWASRHPFFLALVIAAETFGVIGVALIGVWTGRFSGGFSWTATGKLNIHPFIMSLGMVFIFGNGILVYRIIGRFGIPRRVVKVIHGAVLSSVIAFTGFGLYLAFESYVGKSLTSIHAALGILTTCLFVLQLIFGLSIFALPCAPEWLRAGYLRIHAYFGTITLLSATGTCLTGIQAGELYFGAKTDVELPAGILLAAFCAVIVGILTQESFRIQKNESTNSLLSHVSDGSLS